MKVAVSALCLALVLAAIPLCAAPQYKIVDLGSLGTPTSGAEGINDSGQVVGWSALYPYTGTRAFVWDSKDGMKDLGTLGGRDSMAYGINSAGEIVGWSSDKDGACWAVRWDRDGNIKPLNGEAPATATAINDLGQAVGTIHGASSLYEGACAVLWEADGTMIRIGTLPGHITSEAVGINDKGQVVGVSRDSSLVPSAFVWTKETGMSDLGGLEGYPVGAEAHDINNAGQIIGFSNYSTATLWSPLGGVNKLEVSGEDVVGGGYPIRINDQGVAVGWVWHGPIGPRGCVWDALGKMTDLGTLAGDIHSSANAVNNRGEIVGRSSDPIGGEEHAVLWTPATRLVCVDVKPGDSTNAINLKSKGTTPVAVLGEEGFDIKTIDVASITLADTPVKTKPNGKPMASYEDVNGDGLADLVLHFSTQSLKLSSADTSACLTGQCLDGSGIEGTDAVAVR